MRESAGQSSKSSVSYSYTLDTRNDKLAPTKGYYVKCFNEYAGLGGDASFVKNELEGHTSRSVLDGIVRSPFVFFGNKSNTNQPLLPLVSFLCSPDRYLVGSQQADIVLGSVSTWGADVYTGIQAP
jgi:outer membrane protein assembly factor BamA